MFALPEEGIKYLSTLPKNMGLLLDIWTYDDVLNALLDINKEIEPYPTIKEVNEIMKVAARIRSKRYSNYSWEVLKDAIEEYYKESEKNENN